MLAVISPAKTLDFKRPLPPMVPTSPRFEQEAAGLAGSASRLTKKKLAALMHISDTLATLNLERYRHFEDQPRRAAIYAFAGDVYTGFEARSLDEVAIDFAQDHLRILSGLYGLLRPLDEIQPYRLEMGTKWAPRRKSLYDWWGNRIAAALEEDLRSEGTDTIINLASKEYWHAVAERLPASLKVIQVDFREPGPQGLRFNTFNAKRARGMMARYICEHRLDDPEGLKAFDSDGYRYAESGSETNRWLFVRD